MTKCKIDRTTCFNVDGFVGNETGLIKYLSKNNTKMLRQWKKFTDEQKLQYINKYEDNQIENFLNNEKFFEGINTISYVKFEIK